jgi:hypothetical protein
LLLSCDPIDVPISCRPHSSCRIVAIQTFEKHCGGCDDFRHEC